MKASLRLCNQFVTLPQKNGDFDVTLIKNLLTRHGLEVEGSIQFGKDLSSVVVGKIEKCTRHPQADKLQVCEVNLGSSKTQIVCGAPNAREGLFVAAALPGSVLPGNKKILEAELRGVKSSGMLCSRSELGLPINAEVDGDGIWELHIDAQGGTTEDKLLKNLGKPVLHALDLEDTILDISITPNRPDCLCHEGIAREIYVGLKHANIPCEWKGVTFLSSNGISEKELLEAGLKQNKLSLADVSLQIKNDVNVPVFFVGLNQVQVHPSPAWVRNILDVLEVASINNVVDVSNLLLVLYGQPSHAFDWNKLATNPDKSKTISLRHAKNGEAFLGLDKKDKPLQGEDVVVADSQKAHALLGVMGGEESKVDASTQKVIIEFALPNQVNVRRTVRRHGRFTDSAFTFEKGVDKGARWKTAAEFLGLLQKVTPNLDVKQQLAGVIQSQCKDWRNEDSSAYQVEFSEKTCEKVLGTSLVPFAQQKTILENLGFIVSQNKVTFPSWRRYDSIGTVDLAEEISRIVGVDSIPSTPLPFSAQNTQDDAHWAWFNGLCDQIKTFGYLETSSFHFSKEDDWKKMNFSSPQQLGKPVAMLNPILQDQPLLHTSHIPDLLHKVVHNCNFGQKKGQLYTFGRTFQNLDKQGNVVFSETHSQTSNTQSLETLYDYSPRLGMDFVSPQFERGGKRPVETPRLAGILFGMKEEKEWFNQGAQPWDLYTVIAQIKLMLSSHNLGATFDELPTDHPFRPALHPGQAVGIFMKNQKGTPECKGWLGKVHPKVLRSFGISVDCFAFEFNAAAAWQMIVENQNQTTTTGYSGTTETQRFPLIERDFAFILEEKHRASDLTQLVKETLEKTKDKSHLQVKVCDVRIFDIYRGGSIADGKKSFALKIILQPLEKTLQEKEIVLFEESVISAAAETFNAELRG